MDKNDEPKDAKGKAFDDDDPGPARSLDSPPKPPKPKDTTPIDAADLLAWLVIGRTGIGNGHKILRAVRACGGPKGVLEASESALGALGFSRRTIRRIKSGSWSAAEEDRDLLARIGARIVPVGDGAYPSLLAAVARPPPVLYCRGDIGLLEAPQVAMVGARSATAAGMRRAFDFAQEISRAGLAITSGLARGIDTAAHRGALAAAGASLAVIATGPDGYYPSANRELADDLAQAGLVVGEFPPGTMPIAANFPRRNRIISGLALGTLVIEASLRSGSLITARLAVEEGREVFAIPGSIDNPLARGCHALIRDGAKLVESVEDVVEELRPASVWPSRLAPKGEAFDEPRFESRENSSLECPAREAQPPTQKTVEPDPSRALVLKSIGYDPATLDQIVSRTGLAAGAVAALLLALELEGKVDALPGGRFVRVESKAGLRCVGG